MQITAAVLRDHDGPFVLEEVELADPGPDEILVRIAGAGLCHTDVLPRLPGFMAQPPIILGHEGSGVVEAVGENVHDLGVGDHVVLSYDSCQVCDNCRNGRNPYCREFFERNLTGVATDGATSSRDADGQPIASRWFGQSSFATHVLATSRNAVRVDTDLPLEMLGPLGCGVQTGAAATLLSLGVGDGDIFIVFGAGAVGLSAVMAAAVAGASRIVAVDLHASRRELALKLGATNVVDGANPELSSELGEIAPAGAHFTLDTTGIPAVMTTAIHALRPTGTCGLVGFQQGDLVLDPFALGPGRNVKGILEGDAVPQTFIPQLIEWWREGRFPFDRLITTYPLDRINEAERDARDGGVVKPVLVPSHQKEGQA